MRTNPLAALLLLCVALPPLQAGWIIKGTQQEGSNPPEAQTTFLDQPGLRVESPGSLVIFQAAEKKLILADTKAKTYQVMDRASIQKMGAGVNAAMQQMQDAMAQLSPEERAMMQQMMGGQPLPGAPSTPTTAPPAVTTYTKIADGVQVGPWTTTHYEVLENGKKESEIWIAPPNVLPIDRDLIRLFHDLGKFFEDLTAALPASSPAPTDNWSLALAGDNAPSGIPVKEIVFQNGVVASTFELTEAAKSDIAPAQFLPPEGFTETTIPNLPAE
jgi:hypothetical protein